MVVQRQSARSEPRRRTSLSDLRLEYGYFVLSCEPRGNSFSAVLQDGRGGPRLAVVSPLELRLNCWFRLRNYLTPVYVPAHTVGAREEERAAHPLGGREVVGRYDPHCR